MKYKNSILLKAAFLLIAFSLNTIVGFSCSIGINMGFNSPHHHDMEAKEVHVHKDGKVHLHKKAPHEHPKSHANPKKAGKDDCCNDTVVKLSKDDKPVPQSNIVIAPLTVATYFIPFFSPDISYPSQANRAIKYYVRNYHPPIPDIRIAIRSFQI